MHPFIVYSAIRLTPYILQLFLEPKSVFSHQAGDYVMLGFEREETKPFSIANAPLPNGLIELHIRNQEDSPWMQRLFNVQAGDTLWIDGPKPQLKLQHETELNLYIAGGTGIAPIKALLEQRLLQGLKQPTKVYWGARHADELYIHNVMQSLAKQNPLLEYIPVISESDAAWTGATGLVHQYALNQHPELSHATVYLCGAWPMVQTAQTDFTAAGLPSLRYIH